MGAFVNTNISTVGNLAVLAQGVLGGSKSWYMEYVPFLDYFAPQYH